MYMYVKLCAFGLDPPPPAILNNGIWVIYFILQLNPIIYNSSMGSKSICQKLNMRNGRADR